MKEDIGQECIDKLEELDNLLKTRIYPKFKMPINGKKNSQLHISIETIILEEMKKTAENQGLTLSEWCRRKLKEDSQLNRIEKKIDNLIK